MTLYGIFTMNDGTTYVGITQNYTAILNLAHAENVVSFVTADLIRGASEHKKTFEDYTVLEYREKIQEQHTASVVNNKPGENWKKALLMSYLVSAD